MLDPWQDHAERGWIALGFVRRHALRSNAGLGDHALEEGLRGQRIAAL